MNSTLSHLRRIASTLGPALLVLLLGVGVLGATHHHDTVDSDRSCVVCTASHAPAVAAPTTPALSSTTEWRGCIVAPTVEPRVCESNAPGLSRAPPRS